MPTQREVARAALREIRSIREDDRALASLLAYARESGPATELAELLRARIARVTTTGEVRDLRLELADVAFGELGDDEVGIAELEGVRQLDPSFLPALERLAHAYEDRGDAARLASVLATLLDGAVDPAMRRDLAMRLHAIHTTTVPDDDRAISALLAWTRAVPEDLAPVEALLPLLAARGAHRELVEALDRLASVEGRDDRAALSVRAANLCAGPLADAEAALERFARAVFLGDTSSEDALRELGRSAHLERSLARHLEALARAADAPSDAQRRLLEASDLYASVNDPRSALEAAILAYELGYGAEHVLTRIRSIARDARLHARLLSFLEQLSANSSASSHDDVVRGLLECAELASKELGDVERARSFLERALDAAESDGELVARVEATARALDRAIATGGATLERALVARLVAKAREASGEERDALFLRASGILADALDDVPSAYELLHAASGDDEVRVPLFRKLVVLAVRGGRATELDRELDTPESRKRSTPTSFVRCFAAVPISSKRWVATAKPPTNCNVCPR